MRHPILSLAFLIAMPTGPAAVAADFTFHVPVVIRNAPGLMDFQVSCGVRGILPGESLYKILASGTAPRVTVPAGNYSGTVTVSFNALNAIYANAATLYSCNMSASIAGVGPANSGSIRDYYQHGTSQALTEAVVVAEGSITH